MELPHIGAQCNVKSCSQLDFLPVICDGCKGVFCKDHFSYADHSCTSPLMVDYQVPVCPLCNEPVPTKRGQLPDITVSQHIDNECQDDRAKKKRKTTNRCTLKTCKNRELIPVLCPDCKMNFCLKHRHPSDHNCNPREARAAAHSLHNLPGASASSNSQPIANSTSKSSNSISKLLTGMITGTSKCKNNSPADLSSLNNHMDEDEALAQAISASLNTKSNSLTSNKEPLSLQEQEDRMIAEALAASEREAHAVNQRTREKCTMS